MIRLHIASDQQNALPVIKSAIAAKMKRVEIGCVKQKKIQNFEEKYSMSSEQFQNDCSAEDLAGGDDDYISWVGEIHIRQAVLEELRLLRHLPRKKC